MPKSTRAGRDVKMVRSKPATKAQRKPLRKETPAESSSDDEESSSASEESDEGEQEDSEEDTAAPQEMYIMMMDGIMRTVWNSDDQYDKEKAKGFFVELGGTSRPAKDAQKLRVVMTLIEEKNQQRHRELMEALTALLKTRVGPREFADDAMETPKRPGPPNYSPWTSKTSLTAWYKMVARLLCGPKYDVYPFFVTKEGCCEKLLADEEQNEADECWKEKVHACLVDRIGITSMYVAA